MIVPYLLLLRPSHWLKNILVFAGLFFSFSFTLEAGIRAGIALLAFSLLASAIYIINDIADVERDRHHPEKKHRPIASGQVKVPAAVVISLILVIGGGYGFIYLGRTVALVGAMYVLMNLAYSSGLKHVPIVDVMIVALGFVLRVIAGALAIGVSVSHWIMLCTFFLALFVSFGKRKHEMEVLEEGRQKHRRSMNEYTEGFMNQMLGMTATAAVITYSLYTIDSTTIQRFGSDGLIYTTPIVVFGILRYYYLLYNRGQGGEPVRLFSRDRALRLASLVWLVTILGIYISH